MYLSNENTAQKCGFLILTRTTSQPLIFTVNDNFFSFLRSDGIMEVFIFVIFVNVHVINRPTAIQQEKFTLEKLRHLMDCE